MLNLTLAMGYGGVEAQGGAGAMIFLASWLVVCLAIVAGMWKVFTKAGQPGWGAIVPIYNAYLMTKPGGFNSSELHIINTSDSTQSFYGTLYDTDGNMLGEEQLLLTETAIPPYASACFHVSW